MMKDNCYLPQKCPKLSILSRNYAGNQALSKNDEDLIGYGKKLPEDTFLACTINGIKNFF